MLVIAGLTIIVVVVHSIVASGDESDNKGGVFMTEFARGLLLVITVIFVATPAPIQMIMLLTVGVCIGTLLKDNVMVRRAHVLE